MRREVIFITCDICNKLGVFAIMPDGSKCFDGDWPSAADEGWRRIHLDKKDRGHICPPCQRKPKGRK